MTLNDILKGIADSPTESR